MTDLTALIDIAQMGALGIALAWVWSLRNELNKQSEQLWKITQWLMRNTDATKTDLRVDE